jgi:hypothetical protein
MDSVWGNSKALVRCGCRTAGRGGLEGGVREGPQGNTPAQLRPCSSRRAALENAISTVVNLHGGVPARQVLGLHAVTVAMRV